MFLEDTAPYALAPEAKAAYLAEQLAGLVEHHEQACPEYAHLVADWRRHRRGDLVTPEDCPVVPVAMFKELDLRSTGETVMQVRSSATTSASAARIAVDKQTRKRQTLSAARIWTDFVGSERRPYLVFDCEESARGADGLGARGAAILGLMSHASKPYFVCRPSEAGAGGVELDRGALERALEEIGDAAFMAYGFTYILYLSHLALLEAGVSLPRAHPDSILLHSGGWKKLEEIAVGKADFNARVAAPWSLAASRVVDFYGLVEQVGVPFPDCEEGGKHVPYWADVVVRRADDFEPCDAGEVGLLQLVNCLPLSAPNHSVLTEDLGELLCVDGCACGRRGKTFAFRGRAPRAEMRGCSDVARG